MCTPALRSVRNHFKEARISIIVKPSLKEIVEDLPFIDAIIQYDHKGKDRGLNNYALLFKAAGSRFDLRHRHDQFFQFRPASFSVFDPVEGRL